MGAHKSDSELIEVKRKRNRERQADHRERIRLANTEVTADEFFDVFPVRFPSQYAAIKEYEKEFKVVVANELGLEGDLVDDIEYTLNRVATTLYSFRYDLIYRVTGSGGRIGELFGGIYWADVLGFEIIESTRKFDLERSTAYLAAYRELLGLLDQRYGKNTDVNTYEGRSAKAVREELERINASRPAAV